LQKLQSIITPMIPSFCRCVTLEKFVVDGILYSLSEPMTLWIPLWRVGWMGWAEL